MRDGLDGVIAVLTKKQTSGDLVSAVQAPAGASAGKPKLADPVSG
jgi:hypothetical protein